VELLLDRLLMASLLSAIGKRFSPICIRKLMFSLSIEGELAKK
jgi:hypothetical protein